MADALAAVGTDVQVVTWDDPAVDWSGADAVVLRSVRHDPQRRDELVDWAGRVGGVTQLFPDADVVRWNTHTSYLLELEDRGAPIVPTAWLAAGDRVSLADLAADRGWDAVVAKPAVGAGRVGIVVARDPAAEEEAFTELLAHHDVLVQPFLERVGDLGELSVVCIDGRCSHAVRKVPAAGDWRVRVAFGATHEHVEPDLATARLAEWIVAATEAEPLFARVDLLPAPDGTWQLLEVDLVDPGLHLAGAPGSAERLAVALRARLGGAGAA
nr:hypothetical protein [Salsipaludibacter albus]